MEEESYYLENHRNQHDEWLDYFEPDASPWGGYADGDDEEE